MIGRLAFALRAWLVLVVVGVPTWRLVLATRGMERRWRLLRRGLSLMARLGGVALRVEGAPPEEAHVLVVNHESYLDGAILIAALAAPHEIVVGAVLEHRRVAGPLLKAIGCLFVGAADEAPRSQLARLTEAAARGRLAIFPEGHLVQSGGLDPFHLGGFVAAARAGVAVVPVAIVGSRALLPPGSRMLRPGEVSVRFGAPIAVQSAGFGEARRLAARAEAAVSALQFLTR